MDDLLKKAKVPEDGSMYIGELIGEPFLSKTVLPNNIVFRHYALRARPLLSGIVVGGEGEIVLDSAERVPVHVVGIVHIVPMPQAIEKGWWKPGDNDFDINDNDITPEQAKHARHFVQPLKTSTRDKNP